MRSHQSDSKPSTASADHLQLTARSLMQLTLLRTAIKANKSRDGWHTLTSRGFLTVKPWPGARRRNLGAELLRVSRTPPFRSLKSDLDLNLVAWARFKNHKLPRLIVVINNKVLLHAGFIVIGTPGLGAAGIPVVSSSSRGRALSSGMGTCPTQGLCLRSRRPPGSLWWIWPQGIIRGLLTLRAPRST